MAFFQNNAAEDFAARGKTAAAYASTDERATFMKKVYMLLLSSSLAGVGGGVVGVLNFEWLARNILQYWWGFIVMLAVYFGAYVLAVAVRKIETVNTIALYLFAFITGITVAPLLVYAIALLGLENGLIVIGEALGLTVAMFVALTAYVFISKKDFSFMGAALSMLLLVFIVAAVIGIFFQSAMFQLVLSVAAVLIFGGFILYETSMIQKHYATDEYIMAALGLYISIVNLFVALLRILLIIAGGSRD